MYSQLLLAMGMVLILVGAGMLQRHHAQAKRFLWLGIGWLLAISWPPLAFLVAQPLELPYKGVQPDYRNAGAGAIVVLASNVLPGNRIRPFALADRDTYERTLYAAWIQRQLPGTPVLACGGLGNPSPVPYSRTMGHVLESEGVPAHRIWTEERSRSTYENALYGAELLRAKGVRRIILVTEGYHMLRAEKVFRHQGLEVVPAACNFRAFDASLEDWLPGWHALLDNERILHEAVGLLWYAVRGRI